VIAVYKTRSIRLLLALSSIVLLAAAAQARHHKKKHQTPTPVAGTFDYYVMSLSWSPEHCATKPHTSDDPQCGLSRRFGFVLHGLWPQYERGYPQSCSTSMQLGNDVVDSMLDIMPSPDLVRHEWAKHGTCSGLSPETYFGNARAAFSSVKIPPRYDDPTNAFRTAVSEVKQAFQATNPDIDAGEMAVECSGRFLQEVRVCLDKDLRPRACGQDVRDGCKAGITVQPVK
jgi:ribonuclease T2